MMISKLLLILSTLLVLDFSVEAFSVVNRQLDYSSICRSNKNPNYGPNFRSQRCASSTSALSMEPSSTAEGLAVWQPQAYIVLAAIVLGVFSQSFINTMLQGDQGLSAYLSDGQGYNKSKFKPRGKGDNQTSQMEDDPLPWLKLPKFDFVEVAGQSNSEEEAELLLVKKLDSLAAQMREEIETGEKDKAASTLKELNALMEKYGFEYNEEKTT